VITTPCPTGIALSGGCVNGNTPTAAWYLPATREPDAPILTPTPDPPHVVPTLRLEPFDYTVQSGDSLAAIGEIYHVAPETIASANQLDDPNALSIGQRLIVPAPTPSGRGPAFKIIPDSELLYSPSSIPFDISNFLSGKSGYLTSYTEEVDRKILTSAQIIERVAIENSVNPRLLIAVLEYTSHWLIDSNPEETSKVYPLGYLDERRSGLYKQLSWAANELNRGFYLWQISALPAWLLADGKIIPVDETINAGTAGVQQLLSFLYNQQDWENACSEDGLFKTYSELFGYPFDYSLEGLIPPDLAQPLMQLPFEPAKSWSFTGGPHGGWGDGSAWAAVDFAPPGEPMGCVLNDAWVTAVASGKVVHSDTGVVILDLDGDGYVQTGWSVLYLHIDSQDRVKAGVELSAGDRIGHPSCEGGLSNGTHLHMARRYNGMWISADGKLPFNLDGWASSGTGSEYDGFLSRNNEVIEAYNGQNDENQIQR
jgi:murein DD-endopeptidase MepM/ murein hydrolase activator NlpD